jgi:ankyrin repeat protein
MQKWKHEKIVPISGKICPDNASHRTISEETATLAANIVDLIKNIEVEEAIKRLADNPLALMWKDSDFGNFTILLHDAVHGSGDFCESIFKDEDLACYAKSNMDELDVVEWSPLKLAILHDNAKAVDALLKNGAKIDERAKRTARGKKYENMLSDEVVRRVGICD